jgi:hypothetical protein
MSTFQWLALIGLAFGASALIGIVSALDRANKHLSNIAEGLLDLEIEMKKRRP